MNPLVEITASLHFKIKDSEVYGGVGSVGYAAINMGGVKDVSTITEELVEHQTQDMADFLKVPRNSVELISKEEYELNTDEED